MRDILRFIIRWVVGVAVLSGLSFSSCDESLPPKDLRDFLSPVFQTSQIAEVYFVSLPETAVTGAGVSFFVGLKNNSNEYVQAKAKLHGTLEISSPTDPNLHRTFDFSVPELDVVTIAPESEFTVKVPWDQRDDSCRYVCRSPSYGLFSKGRSTYWRANELLTFRAKGRVQFWPNVQTKELPDISFQRQYLIQTELGLQFKDLRTCRNFSMYY